MSMELENKIKEALADIDSFKTDGCLDLDTIDLYAENKLPEPQRVAAEAHLHTCLYCLKQLNDMTELLHYQRKSVAALQTQADHYQSPVSLLQRMKDCFCFTPLQWRYSAITLATAWMVFLVSTIVIRHGEMPHRVPQLNPNSIVKISSMDRAGEVLRVQRGMVVSSDGYIEGNLSPLMGAYAVKVTLRDGSTREIKDFWKDEDTDFAVMKIDNNNDELKEIPIADIENIKIGKKIIYSPDSDNDDAPTSEAIVCDFKQTQGRHSNKPSQYIQVSTQTSTKKTGKLLDANGNLVGFMITSEENINFAVPASGYQNLVNSTKATPVSDLQSVSFSGDAINDYFKGIMARDANKTDEAMTHFQKAIQLNPRLIGAHLELGDLYYKKHQFDKEAQEYEAVLRLNPINVDALYGLAWNMESFGKYREATELYKKALILEPEDTDILYQLGLSYLAQNEKSKAMAMSTRLRRLEPGKGELLRRLIR